MKLLLFSNSTNPGEEWFQFPLPYIKEFLGENSLKCLFIPYAAVTFSFEDYFIKVQRKFEEIGHNLYSIESGIDINSSIEEAEAIVVGGGNTFHLLKFLQDKNIINSLRSKILAGTPYIGWSAGSNIACPTIRTTNDMPIVQVKDFNSLNLLPFQINPHYTDITLEGHGGESRAQRIAEFLEVNPETYVVGLQEGSMLKVEDNLISLKGKLAAKVFHKNQTTIEIQPNESLNFLYSNK